MIIIGWGQRLERLKLRRGLSLCFWSVCLPLESPESSEPSFLWTLLRGWSILNHGAAMVDDSWCIFNYNLRACWRWISAACQTAARACWRLLRCQKIPRFFLPGLSIAYDFMISWSESCVFILAHTLDISWLHTVALPCLSSAGQQATESDALGFGEARQLERERSFRALCNCCYNKL
jgi:hypothetical protein